MAFYYKSHHSTPIYSDMNLGGAKFLDLTLKGPLITYGEEGEEGQVLTAQGGNVPPKWETPSAGGSGITELNTLTDSIQLFAVGTDGSDFNIVSSGDTHTFNLPDADGYNRGALTSIDWNVFKDKFDLPALTSGSILFSNGTTIAQDNSNLFWDDTNNRFIVGANTGLQGKVMFVDSLTGSSATSILHMTATWNTSGTPTALKLNIADSSSNAASLLADLQVGGVTKFNVGKSASVAINDSNNTNYRLSVKATGNSATEYPLYVQNNSSGLLFGVRADSNIISSCSLTFNAGSLVLTWSTRGDISLTADGVLRFRDYAGTSFNRIQLGGTTSSFPAIKRNSAAIEMRLADDSATAGLIASYLNLDKTITAAGTTGDQTINKASGSVNFAAGAVSYLTVTNSLVTTNSVILVTVASNDTTMKSAHVLAASGSFRIYFDTSPTTETRVNFLVLN